MTSPDHPITHRRYLLSAVYAWLGGGLFVASLLYFLYFYLILLDRPVPVGGVRALSINLLLFSLFALHHSIMARTGAKQWIIRVVPAELERSTYVWVASLLFLATCAGWQTIGGLVYEIRSPFSLVGRFVQAAGVLVTLTATAAIRPLELAGLQPAAAASPAPARERHASRTETPLRTSGVYGWVRHPVYFGWVLFVFAAPRMTTDRLVFAAISTAYLAMAVPFEERSLTEAFGERYRVYSRRVRWRIVPWIY
jgi:protein-S-isoprenylcysteine O-methyltransferase Ste14